jgi:putative acetyltransferase
MLISSPLVIAPLDPEDPAALRLLAMSDAYLQSLYPAESNHLESAAALKRPGVTFLGGSIDGEIVACGAAKVHADDGLYAEIKRLFVVNAYRGRGIAEKMMAEIERRLKAAGIALVRLETGVRQPAALRLYRRLGYGERPPFGVYAPDPLSVFMEKRINR